MLFKFNWLLVFAGLITLAGTAQAQDVPTVISPLQSVTDPNGVNLLTGKVVMQMPVLSVPGDPHLRFDRVQNAAPYTVGKVFTGDPRTETYSVVKADGTSDSFRCVDYDCTDITGAGSQYLPNSNVYTEAGTGTVYHFSDQSVVTTGSPQTKQYYASYVSYSDGEVVSYTYQTATLTGDPFHQTFYRPVQLSSGLGYYITITYQGSDFNGDPGSWSAPASASLYSTADPSTPLAKFTYAADGMTITDIGGRIYHCAGCSNALGSQVEADTGSMTLPGETTPEISYSAVSGSRMVGAVVKDGVQWNYAYSNITFDATINGYHYDTLTVTGPNGYHIIYTMSVSDKRNTISSVNEFTSANASRTSSYSYDFLRPDDIILPELNEVNVQYDQYGNISQKTSKPKPGSGLANIVQTAQFNTTSCIGVLCYRPQWVKDGRGFETDFLYNANGQITQQTDPADASGVRRQTTITYTTSGPSRKQIVEVCGGVTCGTSSEIRTEYDYWGNTFLPSAIRRIDAARSLTAQTQYGYDNAGRVTMVDGPLSGTDDAVYYTYDIYGRKTWEVGAKAPNGLRITKHYAYRDSDDKVTAVDTGTIPDANRASPSIAAFTVISHSAMSYDTHRNLIREALSLAGINYKVTDRSYYDNGKLECETVRMNMASLPVDACTLGTEGAQGPDRITLDSYDYAGQLLVVQKAHATSLQQNYVTYTYTPNGKEKFVTDANGNLAQMTYDGFDRLASWTFPSKTTAGQIDTSDYEAYTYDANGNRLTLRKRDGQTIAYAYDALNRMTSKNEPVGADVYYGYDIVGNQLYARFNSSAGPGITNTYDGLGRNLTTSSNQSGTALTISHQFDAAGNRTRVTHPDGTFFVYNFDALGRVGTIQENGSATIVSATYNAEGELQSLARGAATTSFQYDPISRPKSIADDLAGTAGDETSGFEYNPAGQIVSQTWSNSAFAFTGRANVMRSYSRNGLNQYTAAGPASFAYDANGNLTSDGSSSYTYDPENRLLTATGLAVATLVYDPLGRLYQTSGDAAHPATRFLYDGDELIAEYDSAGTLLRRYVHGSEEDDPLIWYEGSGVSSTNRRSFQDNYQGSIVSVADYSGNLIHVNTYDEYGIPGAGNIGRFQYTGQAWIPELGMYYYKARMYSPSLGRFMQTDPVGYKDQVNLYAYVANDPVNKEDPSGNSITELGFLVYDVGQGISDVAHGASAGELINDAVNIGLDVEPVPGLREVKGAVEVGRAVEHGVEAARASGRFASKAEKAAVFERAGGKCEYCGRGMTREPGRPNSMHTDHITPYVKGGKTEGDNLAGACRTCNLSKGSKDLSSQPGPDKFVPSNPNDRIQDRIRKLDN